MNSVAAVLAADSATTVQYYGKDGLEQRYFKGANKIFQLSESHPIGLMIYNSASLLGVPWEVTVKEFRKNLGAKSFNSVEGFANEFFEFLQQNIRFFPEDIRRKSFCDFANNVSLQILIELSNSLKKDPNIDIQVAISGYHTDLSVVPDLPYDEDELTELLQSCRDEVKEKISSFLGILKIKLTKEQTGELATNAISSAIQQHGSDDNYTGMVFAGFGDHSIFPELVSFKRCELWGTKFSAREKSIKQVTHSQPAVIEGFAQTSMVDTFVSGISFEAFARLHSFMAEELSSAVDALRAAPKGDKVDIDMDKLLKERIESFRDKLFGYMRTDHDDPLRRVIGFLPVDEMAELAETLINLQSLKEKVTKPSESVGGPVDVAAITRSEGLVWIRRKHFFDGNINSRYFARKQGTSRIE